MTKYVSIPDGTRRNKSSFSTYPFYSWLSKNKESEFTDSFKDSYTEYMKSFGFEAGKVFLRPAVILRLRHCHKYWWYKVRYYCTTIKVN